MGLSESITQTASRSVQPFLHSSRQRVIGHIGACPSHGDLNPHLIRGSLRSTRISIPKDISIDRFSRFCTANGKQSLQYFTMGSPSPENCPFSTGICTPSNAWVLEPTRAHDQNRILIGSAVSAGLTSVTDIQTDRSRYSVSNKYGDYLTVIS